MSFRSAMLPLLLLGLLAGCDRQVSGAEQADANKLPVEGTGTPAGEAGKPGEKVIVDTIGTLDRSHKGKAAPSVSFIAPGGSPTSIAAFKGKPVLLNLWATWCGPCVGEMPTLDKAASTLKIVAVSQDLDGAEKVTPFFAKGGFTRLQPYLDPTADLSVAYNASLPTSVLYDSTGHEVWRMTGGMDWTTVSAQQLLAEAR